MSGKEIPVHGPHDHEGDSESHVRGAGIAALAGVATGIVARF